MSALSHLDPDAVHELPESLVCAVIPPWWRSWFRPNSDNRSSLREGLVQGQASQSGHVSQICDLPNTGTQHSSRFENLVAMFEHKIAHCHGDHWFPDVKVAQVPASLS